MSTDARSDVTDGLAALSFLVGMTESGEPFEALRAFVATVTTRLSINELRSALARRERFVGEWLPDPIITDGRNDPVQHAEMADSLSLAMLVLLEASRPRSAPFCCCTTCWTMAIERSGRSSSRAR